MISIFVIRITFDEKLGPYSPQLPHHSLSPRLSAAYVAPVVASLYGWGSFWVSASPVTSAYHRQRLRGVSAQNTPHQSQAPNPTFPVISTSDGQGYGVWHCSEQASHKCHNRDIPGTL